MSFYPNVSEKGLNNLSKLAEQQKKSTCNLNFKSKFKQTQD